MVHSEGNLQQDMDISYWAATAAKGGIDWSDYQERKASHERNVKEGLYLVHPGYNRHVLAEQARLVAEHEAKQEAGPRDWTLPSPQDDANSDESCESCQ